MIRIDVVIPQNDVEALSKALKKIHVGGITILKVKGRGKIVAPEIHASKGTEMFRPEFSDKYILQVVVADNKEKDVIEIVRANSKTGKIFISPVSRAVDIETGAENENAIQIISLHNLLKDIVDYRKQYSKMKEKMKKDRQMRSMN